MLRKKKPGIIYLVLLFPLALTVAYLASRFPDAVELYYSRYLYRFLSQAISSATGILPFSVAEVMVVLVVILTAADVVYGAVRLIKSPGKRMILLIRQLATLAVAASVVYFSFIAVWGLNYHRVSIASIANLEVRAVSVEELEVLCRYLIERANGLRELVKEDQNGVMVSPEGSSDMLKRAYKGYQAAAIIYPELGGRYGRPKGVMLSKVLSYQGIGGIYFPFTGEANVNISEPHFMIPFTASHEMAHQRGFAREDEANYIGYLASIMHSDPDFRYSGTMVALQYSMNALARQDRERYNSLKGEYSDGMVRDLNAWNEHCRKYEGFVRETTDRINDAYLQANAQSDGIQSYGRMVDLLLAHYRDVTKVSGSVQ
ncbi:MAG: DUF3810 domain-containing protein [Firmicutes bacterium]|nr:DUF3810 domain-containing protein [Bacillota bacterium]